MSPLPFSLVTHPSSYLFGGDSRALPPRPPALHHGDEAGQHHAGRQDTEHPCEAVDVQRVAILSGLHRAVQVTWAVPWPPFELEYIHVTILLQLQYSAKQMSCTWKEVSFIQLTVGVVLQKEKSKWIIDLVQGPIHALLKHSRSFVKLFL